MGYCVPFAYLPQALWWHELSKDRNGQGQSGGGMNFQRTGMVKVSRVRGNAVA